MVFGDGLLQQSTVTQMSDGGIETHLQAFATDVLEVAVEGLAFGDDEVGERVVDLGHLQVAAVDELHRAGADLGRLGEGAQHLLGALDVELLRVELEALGVVHAARGLHAEQNFVGARVICGDVVAVVGGDQRDVEFALHLEERVADGLVRGEAVVLDFEEVVALAEEVFVEAGCALGFVVLPFHQVLIDFAGETAGEADETFGVLREECLRDARLAIEAVQGGFAGETDEVAVASFVFGEDEEVVVLVFVERGAVVVVLADVEFAAEDRLDGLLLHGVEEVDCAKDVAMVGHGGGGLADFAEVAGEFVDIAGAVEERVVGVKMKVGELCCHLSMLSPMGLHQQMRKIGYRIGVVLEFLAKWLVSFSSTEFAGGFVAANASRRCALLRNGLLHRQKSIIGRC